MSSRLILQRNFLKQNYGVFRAEGSCMMETCEMMDEDRMEKLEQPFLERLKRENEHENMNEKTPDALMTAARRKLEVDRLRKEKLKEVVREVARAHPLSHCGTEDVNLDVVTTMSRVTLTVVSSSPGFFRSQPRNSSLFLSSEVFSSTDPPLTLAPTHDDVKFRLSAKNLDKKDIFGTSDPYVAVSYLADKVNGEVSLGTTSTIQDNVNPQWGEGFRIRYERGTNQRLHFIIWDKDAGEDDKIADITVRLGELVRSHGQMHIPLRPGFLVIEKA